MEMNTMMVAIATMMTGAGTSSLFGLPARGGLKPRNNSASTATTAADWVRELRQFICRNSRYTAMASEPAVTKR